MRSGQSLNQGGNVLSVTQSASSGLPAGLSDQGGGSILATAAVKTQCPHLESRGLVPLCRPHHRGSAEVIREAGLVWIIVLSYSVRN